VSACTCVLYFYYHLLHVSKHEVTNYGKQHQWLRNCQWQFPQRLDGPRLLRLPHGWRTQPQAQTKATDPSLISWLGECLFYFVGWSKETERWNSCELLVGM
jgi:hypothetical protein